MSRVELQALAKTKGIKANLASAEIIKQLEALSGNGKVSSVPVASSKVKTAAVPNSKPKPAVAQSKATSRQELSIKSPEVAKLLDEQGLAVKDLLELRNKIAAAEKVADSKNDDIIKAAKSAANSAKSKLIKATKSSINSSSSLGSSPVASSATVEKPKTAMAVSAPAFAGWTPHMATTPNASSKPVGISSTTPITASSAATIKTTANTAPAVTQRKNNTDGVTLEDMLNKLVAKIGFEGLYKKTRLNAFANSPSISSSLKVLRAPEMGWAREKIEKAYSEL